jgi:hypothetical protein
MVSDLDFPLPLIILCALPKNSLNPTFLPTLEMHFIGTHSQKIIAQTNTLPSSSYIISLTKVQAGEANQLLQSLKNLSSNKPESEIANEILKLLHQFSISLFTSQPEANNLSAWSCPIWCYLTAGAIRANGNFITPDVLSLRLAKFKYFCNNYALIQADQIKNSMPSGMIA